MRTALGISLIGAAMLLGLVGWFAPVYLDTVSAPVLQEVGQAGPPADHAAGLLLAEGKYGPAWRIAAAIADVQQNENPPPTASPIARDLAAFIERHPQDRLTGGAEAYGQQLVALAPKLPEVLDETTPLVFARLLAFKENREALRRMLAHSRNQSVREILATRELTGVRQFMPVASAAGAPLETALLTTALLAQSGFMDPEFSREIAQVCQHALGGDVAAIARLEAFYLSVLGAAQRLDWASLGAWTQHAADPVTYLRATTLLRQSNGRSNVVFASVQLSKRPEWVADYYEKFGDDSWESLELALAGGGEALTYLLSRQLAIHRRSILDESRAPPSETEIGILHFCAQRRELALGLKFAALLLAGALLASGIKSLAAPRTGGEGMPRGMALMQNGVAGVLVLLLIVTSQEPRLFAQPVTEPGALFLEFELPAAQATVESDTMPTATIDQQTVLVLLIFFLLQLVIYIVCLYKLAALKRAPVPAQTRITLLENEEPLFDLGLYVGLAGTVIALLMLAMGVVQASLVAAYASTLFGIVFVALLKVLHVRPLKRKLILER